MNDVPIGQEADSTDETSGSDAVRTPFTPPVFIPKERVTAIYDGIVAIAATLLVLEIGVNVPDGSLGFSDVAGSIGHIMHWIVSFMMIAMFWTEFHFVFAHTRRWDGGLLVLTFAQAAAMSLIPFASGLVGEYPDSIAATLVFALIMALNGILVLANGALLRRKAHLHEAEDSHLHLSVRIRAQIEVYAVVGTISIAGAYLHHPLWGILGWALCPVAMALVLGPVARRLGAGVRS